METVNATRANLLLKKEEINIAKMGGELLLNKRDVLIVEFFSTLKTLMAMREALDNQAYQALRNLVLSLGLEGREKLISFSFIKPSPPAFQINYKNLLGLKIPEILIEPDGNNRDSIISDNALTIEETKEVFQQFLELALRVLPEELKLKRLGGEIKNTTRKVNSLEKYVIPYLGGQVKFIRETLEEREREDIFRLKRLKKKLIR